MFFTFVGLRLQKPLCCGFYVNFSLPDPKCGSHLFLVEYSLDSGGDLFSFALCLVLFSSLLAFKDTGLIKVNTFISSKIK